MSNTSSMWSSGDNIVYGPNRMWTSPNIAYESGKTVDDFFDMNEDDSGNALIQAINDMPVQATNFKITSSNEDIASDDTNAVSVGYLKSASNQFEVVDTEQIYHEGTGTPEWVTENCEVLQPTNPNHTTTDFIDVGEEYTGNKCVKAYNFLITDNRIDPSGMINEQQAVSVRMMRKAISDAAIDSGGIIADTYLAKTEAQNTYETITNHNSDKASLQTAINSKANAQDVTDALALKADKATTYTKAEVDTAISNGTSGKADTSSVYTKTETDTLLTAKANSSDVYTKADVYNKTQTYSNIETDNKIVAITTLENQDAQEVIGYYEEEQWDGTYNPDGSQHMVIVKVPVYGNETENTSFWDTRSGSWLFKTAVKKTLSIPGRIVNRIFIEPKKKRIRSACLAAAGSLCGAKVIAETINFGLTTACQIDDLDDDDCCGELESSDDYHGNRTITNMAHDNEYDTMTYEEDSKTKTLIPDSTVPTVQAIKNHHYTKTEVDNLISGSSPDMSNYYNKTDADARFINVDEPVELIKGTAVIPNTAQTIPSETITVYGTGIAGNTLHLNTNYAFPVAGTKHLVSSLTVSVSGGNVSDLRLQLYFESERKAFEYTNNGDGTYSIDVNYSFTNLEPDYVKIRYAKRTSSVANFTFQITAVSVNYEYSTTINQYYSKTETDSLISNNTNWNWTNSSTPYAFGVNSNYIQMTENGTIVNRIAPGGIYTEVISPESMIQFGKTITGGNASGRWRSSIVGVANDNYNPTTYSTVDTDTIVPSVKYVSNNYYPKSYVDALEARIAALENPNSGESGGGGTWVY